MRKWTDAQKQAINADNGEIIVSASAGSGKTSVMIERIIRLIKSGADIENLLCLTFTKLSAEEMKERLAQALLESYEKADSEWEKERLIEQIDKLAYSDVTTIDSFCAKIVRRYFERSDIPVSATLASEDETKALKYASAMAVLERMGEDIDDVYLALVGFLGKKRSEDSLINLLIAIDGFLSTLPEPEQYLTESEKKYYTDIDNNPVIAYKLSRMEADIRLVENTAIRYMHYDLPYPEEVHDFALRLMHAKTKGVFSTSQVLKEGFPKKPNYNCNPYRKLGDSKEDITHLKEIVEDFEKEYGSFDYEQVTQDVRSLAPFITKLVKIINEFRLEYTKRLRQNDLTDFAEIEHEAKKLLEIPEIQKEVRSRYHHVMVDEYQDTNRLQEKILTLAGGDISSFMVGDVKQSIYTFRHAEPEIFLERKNSRGVSSHVLRENFRQDERIINAVNGIFESVMHEEWAGVEYLDEKMIKGGDAKDEKGDIPVVIKYLNKCQKQKTNLPEGIYSVKESKKEEDEESLQEAEFVFNSIRDLVCNKKIKLSGGEERNIEYKDIVVISRSRSEGVKAIARYLIANGIPVGVKNKEKLPTSAEILINLLRVIDNPAQDEAAAIIMLSPLFDFTEQELAQYKIEADKRDSFYNCLCSLKGKYDKLDEFFRKLEDYSYRAQHLDVRGLLEYVVADTNYAYKSERMGEGESKVLTRYLDSLNNSHVADTVTGYLTHFDKYPTFETEYETGGDNCVRFITMHGSKGLEFPVVFLVEGGKGFNTQDTKRSVVFHKKLGIGMTAFDEGEREYRQNFIEHTIKSRQDEENVIQEMRLLYVALTRAKNYLYVSGQTSDSATKKTDEKKVNTPLEFITVALNKNPALYSLVKIAGEEIAEQQKAIDTPTLDALTAQEISALQKNMEFIYPYEKSTKTPSKYTVTGVMKETAQEEVHVPLYPSESAESGTIYHKVMEKIDFELNSTQEISAFVDKLILDGELSECERGVISPELLLTVLHHDVFRYAQTSQVYREHGFLLRVAHNEISEGGVEDEVLLQGVIDLLMIKDDEAIIVDYKYSGASEDTLRTRYEAQLKLYAKAVKEITGVRKLKGYLLSLKSAKLIQII